MRHKLGVSLSEVLVKLQGIHKSYHDISVLNNISLDICKNRTTAIVGESGSGKSTLLQIINGLVIPEAGHVSISGELIDYQQLPRMRREMGYAVQGAGLFPHLSVFENITIMAAREAWSVDAIKDRFDELLALLNLNTDFAPRYPHSLSGGQQQRVSLCRAMMLNPPLLLLDEPFSALDPITRKSIHKEFINLQNIEPRTTILVTHDMREARKLAQNLVILKAGRIVQAGTLTQVQNNPIDSYVSRLFSDGDIK